MELQAVTFLIPDTDDVTSLFNTVRGFPLLFEWHPYSLTQFIGPHMAPAHFPNSSLSDLEFLLPRIHQVSSFSSRPCPHPSDLLQICCPETSFFLLLCLDHSYLCPSYRVHIPSCPWSPMWIDTFPICLKAAWCIQYPNTPHTVLYTHLYCFMTH